MPEKEAVLFFSTLSSQLNQLIQRRFINQIGDVTQRRMNDDLKGMWKDAVLICFKVQSKHAPEGNEKNEKELGTDSSRTENRTLVTTLGFSLTRLLQSDIALCLEYINTESQDGRSLTHCRRSPTGAKDFCSSFCVQAGSGAHAASCTMVSGVLSPGVKRCRGVMLPLTPI
jgi:hypothetical protein